MASSVSLADFEFAGGTAPGSYHREHSMNNQDGMFFERGDDYVVAVVTDGVGSAPFSEVGSRSGAQMVGNTIAGVINGQLKELDWRGIQRRIEFRLEAAAGSNGGSSLSEVIRNFYLFTIVGLVMTDTSATFFHFGDGQRYVNGEGTALGKPGAPPQVIAYNLIMGYTEAEKHWFQTRDLPLGDIEHCMIATDGIADLSSRATWEIPGTTELCGGPEQFWQNDRYFAAGFPGTAVSSHLNMLTICDMSAGRPTTQSGRLKDDTTLIVCRRKSS